MKALTICGCACFVVAASVVAGEAQNLAAPTLNRGTGSIVGRAIFQGIPGPMTPITLDSACTKLAVGDLYDEAVVTDRTGGLRNAFVYLKEGINPAYYPDVPADPIVLTQRGCRFEPRVVGVRVGQPLTIVNGDETLHNVHGKPLVNPPFNIGQPIAGMRLTRSFELPEVMVPLTSDIHPWMAAFVAVVAHPFFAVTQPDGTFVINDVPPGQYTMDAWHEALGTETQRITVPAGQTAKVSSSFAAR